MSDLISLVKKKFGESLPGGGENAYYRCPMCIGSKTGRDRFTLGINVFKRVYGCVRCGWGGHLSDIFKGELRDITIKIGPSVNSSRYAVVNLPDYVSFKEWDPSQNETLPGMKRTYEYAKKRNFLNVECGYSSVHLYYVLFPMINDKGNFVYYQGRSSIDAMVNFKDRAKTVNPKIPKPGMLFAPYGFREYLLLVEGIADSITSHGHALLGKVMTPPQYRFVDDLIDKGGIRCISVWLDSDAVEESHNLVLELYRRYREDIEIRHVVWPDGVHGDPDSIDDSLRGDLLARNLLVDSKYLWGTVRNGISTVRNGTS